MQAISVSREIGGRTLSIETGSYAKLADGAVTVGGEAQIMLVEDDVAFRRTVAAYLEDSGFTVIEADDGMAALELIERRVPDVVVSDLRMPRMSGLDLLAALRARVITVPVIMISGTADKVLLAETVQNGAAAFLTKPVDFGLLKVELQKLATGLA